MDRDSRLYRYIYEFYVTRIQSGYYIKGDAIPSIHEISETFGVSDKTTRRMLRQLKEDGFISSGSGRSSVVIKDFSNEDHADFCRTYYLAHKDAALELQCLRRSFLSSILFPAFCRLPADQREQLSQYLSRVRRWDFRAFIDFFCTVLDSLGNPLLASLFTESTMFGHLSDLYMMTDASYSDFYFDRLANYMEDLLTCHAAEDFGGIKRQLDQISQLRAEKLRKNLEASYARTGQPVPIPVPFRWYITMGRIEHRSFTAQILLYRILCRQYQPGEFLPSVSQLAEEFSVAEITIRRSLSLLVSFNAVKTLNGKGTMALDIVNQQAMQLPQSEECRKELLLSLEAFQVLALTAGSISSVFFPGIPADTLAFYAEQMRECVHQEDCYRHYKTCFDLFYAMGNSALSEVCSQLMWQTLWPISCRSLWLTPGETASIMKILLRSLEERDAKLFSRAAGRLFLRTFQTVRKGLIEGGVKEAAHVAWIEETEEWPPE